MTTEYYTMRYRIYPSAEQAQQIEAIMGACRTIRDAALHDMIAHQQHTGETLTPRLHDYLAEPHMQLSDIDPLALSHVLLTLKARFDKLAALGRQPAPVERKARRSYTTSAKKGRVSVEGDLLKLPTVGTVKIILHRPLPPQRPINATITRTPSGSYYVSLLYGRPHTRAQPVLATEDNTLGLDYSNPLFYVDSEGRSPEPPRFYEAERPRLERELAKLRRKQKGSANYEKQRQKVARIYEKIKNRRRDWQHKESRRLADRYEYIAVEDLDLQAIAGTYRLGKNAMDNGYRTFLELLAYKLDWQGKSLIKINRWVRSSQKCHKCGYLNRGLTLETRFWDCPQCGAHNGRDHNAAINIRNQVLKYRA